MDSSCGVCGDFWESRCEGNDGNCGRLICDNCGIRDHRYCNDCGMDCNACEKQADSRTMESCECAGHIGDTRANARDEVFCEDCIWPCKLCRENCCKKCMPSGKTCNSCLESLRGDRSPAKSDSAQVEESSEIADSDEDEYSECVVCKRHVSLALCASVSGIGPGICKECFDGIRAKADKRQKRASKKTKKTRKL